MSGSCGGGPSGGVVEGGSEGRGFFVRSEDSGRALLCGRFGLWGRREGIGLWHVKRLFARRSLG